MSDLEILVKAWDAAHWELGEAFQGLADDGVWVRPHPRLLSIGEIVGHIGYWEGQSFTLEPIESPLQDAGFRYFTSASAHTPAVQPLGAEALYREVERIHVAAKEALLSEPRVIHLPNPYREGWTWHQTLEYMAFHVAYHTGQIYSVRHMLGHETVDN